MAFPALFSNSGGAARFLRPLQRSACALAIGAALLAPVATGSLPARAAGIYDNMEYLAKHLPPGILHCRDRAIRILYAQEVSGLWDDFNRVDYRMLSEFNGYYDSVIVKPWSRNIEPSLYLLREQINFKYGGITVILPKVSVPQMRVFDEGIEAFYGVYVYRYPTPQEKWHEWHSKGYEGHSAGQRFIEEKFIHSIAYAAYDDEATAERKAWEYLEANLDGRKRVVLDMKRRFQEMGNGDRDSANPRDPYNRKLVANWAHFFLFVSLDWERGGWDAELQMLYEHISIPLMEATIRVSGPPHYML